MWTEADLAPVPVDVAAALGPASAESDAGRFMEWHRPLALSAEARLQDDPAAAARTLAGLYRTSLAGANSARSLLMYQVCLSLAEKDLDLIIGAVEELRRRGDSEANERLLVMLQDAPSVSVENAMIGEYLGLFQYLDSMLQDHGWEFLIMTDLSATVHQLNEAFRSESAKDVCALSEGIMPSSLASVFTYNAGGRIFLSSLKLTFCTVLPRVQEIAETVAAKRRTLFDALNSDP
jgi:hypothetical protein